MKSSHKLFFAIPFDSATKNLYDRIRRRIISKYPNISAVIGNDEIGPSPEYSDIVSFKSQNRELTKQFVAKIRESDIVIADLTHNNPNVHLELGISLMENKNILRVTGRSISELGFDIQNLEVFQYKCEEQLANKIMVYLDTFFKIKQLPISKDFIPLYCQEPFPIKLRASEKSFDFQSNCPSDFIIRDGAIRIEFEILRVKPTDNWFGVYFRAYTSPLMGSHLLYVRQNGAVDIAVYPGPRVIETFSANSPISGRQILTVQFENDFLEAQIGNFQIQTDKLSHQTVGHVFVAAWYADVDVHSVEMISRDTIEWV